MQKKENSNAFIKYKNKPANKIKTMMAIDILFGIII